MSEKLTVGLYMPMLDFRIRGFKNNTPFPQERFNVHSYLEQTAAIDRNPAGMTGTVMKAFAGLTDYENIRLLGSVGRDSFGISYQTQMQRFGEFDVVSDELTGVCAYVLNMHGMPRDLRIYEDAARHAPTIDRTIIRQNIGLFFAESSLFRNEELLERFKPPFEALAGNADIFALNLSLVGENKTTKDMLFKGLGRFTPDIVIGNEDEITYLGNNPNSQQALARVFPKSRIVVMTAGEKGAFIRLDGEVLPQIPVYPVGAKENEFGLGDTFMGLFVGGLLGKAWTRENVRLAAMTASFGAGIMATKTHGCLEDADFVAIREFARAPYLPHLSS